MLLPWMWTRTGLLPSKTCASAASAAASLTVGVTPASDQWAGPLRATSAIPSVSLPGTNSAVNADSSPCPARTVRFVKTSIAIPSATRPPA